ncbi:hypothetical protein AJ87_47395 [Rhizobium yanglingense]|nr:hypothetical protein AJ87_47395 [Rhizobium yanglingense]
MVEAQADSRLTPFFTEVEAKFDEIGVRIIDEPDWNATVKDGKPILSWPIPKDTCPPSRTCSCTCDCTHAGIGTFSPAAISMSKSV